MVQNPIENRNESRVEAVHVDPMRQEDLEQVLRIERASFKAPWTRGYFLQEIRRNPLAHIFVLRNRVEGRVLGYIDAWFLRKQAHINNLAVATMARNHGYGEILIRHVLALARREECRRAVLEVRVSNKPAQRLYTRLGFRAVGEMHRYYSDGENALIMIAEIAGDD